MSIYKYSLKLKGDAAKKSAAAQFHDADASYKDLTQVFRAIKGKSVADAFRVLDDAIALRHAIPYAKFNKGLGHRKELGGKKGRYPKKECRLVKSLLQNAVANASHKGLDEKRLVVRHAAAFKQNSFPRYRKFWASSVTLGYGKRAIWANYETARAEIMVEEREPRAARAEREKEKEKIREQKSKQAKQAQAAKPAEKKAEETEKSEVGAGTQKT